MLGPLRFPQGVALRATTGPEVAVCLRVGLPVMVSRVPMAVALQDITVPVRPVLPPAIEAATPFSAREDRAPRGTIGRGLPASANSRTALAPGDRSASVFLSSH